MKRLRRALRLRNRRIAAKRRRSRPNPPQLTRLDLNQIKPGDVLFCGPKTAESGHKLGVRDKVIQFFTDGIYTHCALYLGNEKVVHAVYPGVEIIDFHEFEKEYRYLSVTRLLGSNHQHIQRIVRYAERCARNKVRYNLLGALLLPLRQLLLLAYKTRSYYDRTAAQFRAFRGTKLNLERGAVFCSEFVIRCYKVCGCIDRQTNYFYSANYWSPSFLAKSKLFRLVGYWAPQGLEMVERNDPYYHPSPKAP